MPAARRLATVATFAVVALVGACSDEPEPRFAEPTESASSTASASPVDGGEDVRDAERAVVARFVEAVTTGLVTGNPQDLLSITKPSCQNCQTFADNIKAAFAGGKSVEGASWSIRSAEYVGARAGFAEWRIVVDASQERAFDAKGELVNVVDAMQLEVGLLVDIADDVPVANFSLTQ